MFGIRQAKGEGYKVRPVLDYRPLNEDIQSHPGGATPLCSDRLREWRQRGCECAVVDLRRAYLQVHVDESLWVHQAVRWKDEIFLLTRLGFGLTSAPKIMTRIVEHVLAESSIINKGVSSYIDDLFVDLREVSASRVTKHFEKWGLVTKEPEPLGPANRVRVLGLKVEGLAWSRDKELPDLGDDQLTRRQVHAILGEWTGHFPVAGWLRIVCGHLQRLTAEEGTNWDKHVSEDIMRKLREVSSRLRSEGDPVKGLWPVEVGTPVTVWADASDQAVGVVLEIDGETVEDAAWLRPRDDSAHINRAELDAVIHGLNMALRWGKRKMKIMSDSVTVCSWLTAVIDKSHNVRTNAMGEILIKRRLDTVREIIAQEELQVTIQHVRSQDNRADPLTRVPRTWAKKNVGVAAPASVVHVTLADVRQIHDRCHFGVDRTLQLARERFGDDRVSRRLVRKVVNRCQECARIDPAVRFRWDKGAITANWTWQRWAADITHVGNQPYVTVIDVASGFTVWLHLCSVSAFEVSGQLRQVISELGPPESILTDNGTVFRSREMQLLLRRWEIAHDLSCAYRPQGNSVVERVHRTVKRTATRSACPIEEAVFWVNATRGQGTASPYELVFAATPRKPGVNSTRREFPRPQSPPSVAAQDPYRDCESNPFVVGDRVYLRSSHGRCDVPWSGPHTVTALRSSVSVELDEDGVSRHISHLRLVPSPISPTDNPSLTFPKADGPNESFTLDGPGQDGASTSSGQDGTEDRIGPAHRDPDGTGSNLGRGKRECRRTMWWNDYVT